MQQQGQGPRQAQEAPATSADDARVIDSHAAHVRVAESAALALLGSARAADVIDAGVSLNLLDKDDRSGDHTDVLFFHQLLQEYFAARALSLQPLTTTTWAEIVHSEWRADKMSPSLSEVVAGLDMNAPLPPPPTTGWEETVKLASAMHAAPDAFVRGLMAANLPLAGRCAAAPDSRVSETVKRELRQALIARTQDMSADLRAHIDAGEALGDLGDPRFERRRGPHGDYLLPPLIRVPGGTYTIGDDNGIYADEKPAHPVEMSDFELGQFPVTNAEYACFLQAEGYDQERWWETDAAQAWRRGEGVAEGARSGWRRTRKALEGWSDEGLRNMVTQNRATPTQVDDWLMVKHWSEQEFEAWLVKTFPDTGAVREPGYWTDTRFNNPAQPVVGVSWHEARAYCAWLSAQTAWTFRLPTEAEWEAACRGQDRRRFAYGDDFDVARGNTFESHILRTTPVGVFPDGATPSGLVDMTGNTWDWTSSLFVDYPYANTAAHEDVNSTATRVLRGGSWSYSHDGARASYRDFDGIDRSFNIGFRLVCVRPLIL